MDTVGELRRHAANYGYNVTAFEKTVHLLGIMDALSAHPYLRDQFALKGGSALNLFLLDAPRLSVDLDLNFVGAPERPAAVAAVADQLGGHPLVDLALGPGVDEQREVRVAVDVRRSRGRPPFRRRRA